MHFLFGLAVLVLDIWAIFEIVQSNDDNMRKFIWILVIFFLPLLGFVLWYLFARKPR